MSSIVAAEACCGSNGTDEVFHCLEESSFYAQCLHSLIFAREARPQTVVEFGSGDGGPVIEALRHSGFTGAIQGFELNPAAYDIANRNIQDNALNGLYRVRNECFFAAKALRADCLIANPPYLPAPDRDIRLPLLYGGEDGSMLTNILLSLNYDTVLLMISSYSNPIGTLRRAAAEGYAVSSFLIAPLSFGVYSSEPKVRRRIETLRKTGRAFYDGSMYLLAGVRFEKRQREVPELSLGLIKILTAL
jgi:methylase of polypeptide subunit release factors